MSALETMRRGGLIAALLLACSCQPRPRAPALLDEPVYQNEREGFRFLVPEGWSMSARSDLPPGPADKERLLVQYRRSTADRPATFEVSMADLPEGTDLAAYLGGPAFGAERWKPSAAPQPLQVGGADATRFRFTARVDGADLAREVTAVRRGGRIYFFTVLAPPADTTAPEQVRRAVGRIVWTK
jgi:hypothetical protein